MTGAAELRAFLGARDAAESAVDPAMRSVLLEGHGDAVFMLLHGLTASPPAWSSIAAELNARGATVAVVRLPLHGHADRLTRVLEKLTAEMLTSDVRAVIERIALLGKRVTVAGHSLGGTLAVHAAATLPHVDRVVAVAPFLGIASVPHELHPKLAAGIRALPNLFLWWDPVKRERQQPAHGYPRYPLHSLAAGLQIADAVYSDAERPPQARAIEFVINTSETSVNNRTVLRLAKRWRTASPAIFIHRLEGLPPSHDIIEPARAESVRVRDTLVELLWSGASAADSTRRV